MRRLAWALAPFCAAVFLAVYLVPKSWYVTGGLSWLVLSALALFFHRRTRTRVFLTAVGLGLGFLWCGVYHAVWCAPAQSYIGERKAFAASVLEYPEETDYGVSLTVRIRPEHGRSFRSCLYVNEGYDEVTLGDELEGTAVFSTAEVIRDREVSYFTARGIHVLGKKVRLQTVIHPDRLAWYLYPRRFSHWLRSNLEALFSGDSLGLVQALATGDRGGMSDAFRTALSRAGLSHMTAVSGMHVVVLVQTLMLLPGNRRWKSAAALPVMVLFALCTGLTPSVIRAVVMESLLVLGALVRRQYDSPTALSVALFLLLVQNPWAAGSIGLQLSFAAVAGIQLLLPRLRPERETEPERAGKKAFRRQNRLLMAAREVVALTLAATAFTLPLSVLYFDTVSVIAPLSNLLVLWCVPWLMVFALLSGVLYGFLPLAGAILALPAKILSGYVWLAVRFFARLPFSALSGDSGWIRFWLLAAYVLLALYCARRPKGWRKILPAGGLAGLLVFALAANRASVLRGDLTTGVLDVGQGQCVVLLSGDRAIAVDCGGSRGTKAGDALADYLNQLGIVRLELLVLTHYDSDHTNGVEELLERIAVSRIAGPDVEDDNGNREILEALAEEHGVEFQLVGQDRSESFGEAQAKIYAPVSENSDNDASLAVCASAGEFDVLITGDMESQVEETLAKRKRLPDVEVLLVGHHGSRYSTSTDFLEAVTPEVAVISVGEDNSYGHPTQDVLDRLKAEGIDVYRTDLNGTVTISDQ